MTALNWSL